MKPVVSEVVVARPVADVYDRLADLPAHEAFTDHMLVDWTASGPRAGVGARVRARARTPGPPDWIDIEVVEAAPPTRIVERNVGAGGKRVARGTYTLEAIGEDRTRVRFELAFEQVPTRERMLASVLRPVLERGNQRALDRLAEQLGPG